MSGFQSMWFPLSNFSAQSTDHHYNHQSLHHNWSAHNISTTVSTTICGPHNQTQCQPQSALCDQTFGPDFVISAQCLHTIEPPITHILSTHNISITTIGAHTNNDRNNNHNLRTTQRPPRSGPQYLDHQFLAHHFSTQSHKMSHTHNLAHIVCHFTPHTWSTWFVWFDHLIAVICRRFRPFPLPSTRFSHISLKLSTLFDHRPLHHHPNHHPSYHTIIPCYHHILHPLLQSSSSDYNYYSSSSTSILIYSILPPTLDSPLSSPLSLRLF